MDIILAILLGGLFGFVLQKVGAANPQQILGMLRLSDLHLMKAIFLAIGISSLTLFGLLATGMIDGAHLSVKSSYVGVIGGGIILGTGWAITGFCPGTGLVEAGAGRKDALVFILGGLLGAWLFTLSFGALADTFLFADLGGKATLAQTGSTSYPAMFGTLPGLLVAGSLALMFIAIAWLLPEHSTKVHSTRNIVDTAPKETLSSER